MYVYVAQTLTHTHNMQKHIAESVLLCITIVVAAAVAVAVSNVRWCYVKLSSTWKAASLKCNGAYAQLLNAA